MDESVIPNNYTFDCLGVEFYACTWNLGIEIKYLKYIIGIEEELYIFK